MCLCVVCVTRGCADVWNDASVYGQCEQARGGSAGSAGCRCKSEPGYGECGWRSKGMVLSREV
jgi:hypothetical protein